MHTQNRSFFKKIKKIFSGIKKPFGRDYSFPKGKFILTNQKLLSSLYHLDKANTYKYH